MVLERPLQPMLFFTGRSVLLSPVTIPVKALGVSDAGGSLDVQATQYLLHCAFDPGACQHSSFYHSMCDLLLAISRDRYLRTLIHDRRNMSCA
jgi:hypothetical protein